MEEITVKKLFILTLALVLALSLAACGSGSNPTNDPSSGGGSNATDKPSNNNSGGVTLDSMKKAARDAGYEVEDSYSDAWGDGIVGGFTVTYPSEYSNIHTPVLEFKDKASADAVAKQEKDAGYNYPVQNGKWVQIEDKWYYFDEDGKLAVNATIDGYEVGADGAWK